LGQSAIAVVCPGEIAQPPRFIGAHLTLRVAGGHYFVDVIAGAAIAMLSIYGVRCISFRADASQKQASSISQVAAPRTA